MNSATLWQCGELSDSRLNIFTISVLADRFVRDEQRGTSLLQSHNYRHDYIEYRQTDPLWARRRVNAQIKNESKTHLSCSSGFCIFLARLPTVLMTLRCTSSDSLPVPDITNGSSCEMRAEHSFSSSTYSLHLLSRDRIRSGGRIAGEERGQLY